MNYDYKDVQLLVDLDHHRAELEMLDMLDAKRAYAEAQCDWEVERAQDKYYEGFLTLDDLAKIVDEVESSRIVALAALREEP